MPRADTFGIPPSSIDILRKVADGHELREVYRQGSTFLLIEPDGTNKRLQLDVIRPLVRERAIVVTDRTDIHRYWGLSEFGTLLVKSLAEDATEPHALPLGQEQRPPAGGRAATAAGD